MKVKVGVFFGGKSVEHEVSIISALQAVPFFDGARYDAVPVYIARDGNMYVGERVGRIEEYKDIPRLIAKSRRVVGVQEDNRLLLVRYPVRRFGSSIECAIDVAFPIVHGTNVEDGALQGYFRTMSVPFVGCDVTASAVGMDKHVTKAALKDAGIPVWDSRRVFVKSFFRNTEKILREIGNEFPFPVIVKPFNLGSSIGIKKAADAMELREALEYAFQYTDNALVGPVVKNLREINCAVLGDQESAVASECEEPIGVDAILSYSDKYVSGGKAKGMSAAKRKLPADIPAETRDTIRRLAVETFQALRCNGVSRVDFLLDDSGGLWVNEINTIPGSLSFYLWEPVGMPYGDLLDRLIQLALKRERENAAVSYSFDTNILANFSSGGTKGLKN